MEVEDWKECVGLMRKLREETKDVGVFVDGGWNEAECTYTIVTNGDGQKPHAEISEALFRELRGKGYLGGNILITYKKRRFHRFYNSRQRKPVVKF
jgi:hypothetical protein